VREWGEGEDRRRRRRRVQRRTRSRRPGWTAACLDLECVHAIRVAWKSGVEERSSLCTDCCSGLTVRLNLWRGLSVIIYVFFKDKSVLIGLSVSFNINNLITRYYKEKDCPVAFPILLLSDLLYQRLQQFKFISNEYPITL